MKERIKRWLELNTGGEVFQSIYKRLAAIEGRNQLTEIDCPICNHKTLMKENFETIWNGGWCFTTTRKGFYCFGCGKTFQKYTEGKWVEVK